MERTGTATLKFDELQTNLKQLARRELIMRRYVVFLHKRLEMYKGKTFHRQAERSELQHEL